MCNKAKFTMLSLKEIEKNPHYATSTIVYNMERYHIFQKDNRPTMMSEEFLVSLMTCCIDSIYTLKLILKHNDYPEYIAEVISKEEPYSDLMGQVVKVINFNSRYNGTVFRVKEAFVDEPYVYYKEEVKIPNECLEIANWYDISEQVNDLIAQVARNIDEDILRSSELADCMDISCDLDMPTLYKKVLKELNR